MSRSSLAYGSNIERLNGVLNVGCLENSINFGGVRSTPHQPRLANDFSPPVPPVE